MTDAATRSILIVCDDDPGHAGNVLDHLRAFGEHSRHAITYLNPRTTDYDAVSLDPFDVVVIHYTIVITSDAYLPRRLADRIASFAGLKVQFIQDEYRWVDDMTHAMRDLGIGLLYSLVPEDQVPKIYGGRLPSTEVVTTLAGYVPDRLVGLSVPPIASRPIDVGYRGRHIPYWLGRLAQDKTEIARKFVRSSATQGLRQDIAWTESDRIYGEDWIAFLLRCKSTLGTESGASIVDFDGTIEREVAEFVAHNPRATFDEVESTLLQPHEGNAVINVVSPRVFEAAALGTALVLFPGSYSGVVEPWRHYVPLEKDFSNIEEVVESIRDETLLQRMADTAYQDLVASGQYSLRRFIEAFDAEVEQRTLPRARPLHVSAPSAAAAVSRPLRERLLPRSRAKTAVENAILFSIPEVRRLRRAYARSTDARMAIGEQRLREDLVKLGVLIGIQRGHLRAREPFVVVPLIAGDRLILASRAASWSAFDEARAHTFDALEALREGAVNELIWHHAGVGQAVNLHMGPLVAPIAVGYHGVYGVHHFSALERLGRYARGSVISAVRAAMIPGPPSTWQRVSPVINEGLGDIPGTVVRGVTALQFALTHSDFRRLMRAYLGRSDLRTRIHAVDLLDDTLKLAMLGRLVAESVGSSARAQITASMEGSALHLQTGEPNAKGGASPPLDRLEHVTTLDWDCSPLGGSFPVTSTINTGFDADGVHRFRAISLLCAMTGEPLGSIIRPILQGEPRDRQ